MAKPDTLYAVIRSIRACFNRLRALGDNLHESIEVTSAMRAVMESISDSGEQTVSDIARQKSVSRQHVQVLADQLAESGFINFKKNPTHKRASLLAFTAKGARTFSNIRKRESDVLCELARDLSEKDVATTLRMLLALEEKLDLLLNKGDKNEH